MTSSTMTSITKKLDELLEDEQCPVCGSSIRSDGGFEYVCENSACDFGGDLLEGGK